jgi:hypothetical protein
MCEEVSHFHNFAIAIRTHVGRRIFGEISMRFQLQSLHQLVAIYEEWLTTNRDQTYQKLSKDIDDFWIVSGIGEHIAKDYESILDAI